MSFRFSLDSLVDFGMFRLVHNLSYYVLQALFDMSYEVARACFQDLIMYEVMKVVYID